jgi:hypothetical protein
MRSTRWPRGSDRSASSALRWAGGCLATAALLSIAGCVPSTAEPAVTPTATASAAAPAFASDEEALAAATAAYAEYLRVSDEIAAAGGQGAEKIIPLVSDSYLELIDAEFANYRDQNLHTTGATSFDSAELQSYAANADGTAEVAVYMCLDVTSVRIIDASSRDVTSRHI